MPGAGHDRQVGGSTSATKRIAVDDAPPDVADGDADRRGLTDPLGATNLAIDHYRLAQGEHGSGLHAHGDQEEVFLLVEGEAVVETMDGEVVVGVGEAVWFARGEFHSGLVARDGPVSAIAIGAPRDSRDVRVPLQCPDCGHEYRCPGFAGDGTTPVLVCPDCGEETTASCPACGSDAMRAELAASGDSAVGVCADCGAEAD